MAWALKLLLVASLVGCCAVPTAASSTAAPTSTSVTSTAAPTSTSVTSTAAPTSTSVTSTAAPTSTSVTSTQTSTQSPAATTPSTGVSSATTISDVSSSSPNVTDSTGATSASTVQTAPTPDPCVLQPCGDGSTCEARANQTRVCVCLSGDYYSDSKRKCETAKVFPGELSFSSITYDDKMADKTSLEFLKTSEEIVNNLNEVFGTDPARGYTGSTVLQLSSVTSRNQGVKASVEIIFSTSSEVDDNFVKDTVATLPNTEFEGKDLCDSIRKPCNGDTTECKSGNGAYNCTCLSGFISSEYTERLCIACPSGQQASESGKCELCSFGYSGFNCKESWKLMLVIVGSVLGGLLLIAIILLPIVANKSSKKSSKKNKNQEFGMSHPPAKAPMVNGGFADNRPVSANSGPANGLAAFANAGVPRIPRATTTSSWDRSTNLQMTPSNSRQNLIPGGRNTRLYDDPDDMSDNLYGQARPQSNPYIQNRAQINPYAQGQGQSKPYYTQDNGRRY